MRLLLILLHAVYAQPHNNKHISSVLFPGEESIFEEPIHILPEIKGKTKIDNTEFFDKSKNEKWKDQFESKTIWKEHKKLYKTNTEIFENDPIEMEIADMVPRSKAFYDDSGLEMYTPRPISIRPISSEAEITMSMTKLPDKVAPDMQPKQLEALPLSSIIPNDFMKIDSTTHIPITFKFGKDSVAHKRKDALDLVVLSRMDYDIKILIDEVAILKKMVFKLIHLHEKERRKISKRKRNNPSQNLANELENLSSSDNFIHMFKNSYYNF